MHWDGLKLVSHFKCDEISDVVTTRWLEEDEGGGTILMQETAWENVSFTRRFLRLDD